MVGKLGIYIYTYTCMHTHIYIYTYTHRNSETAAVCRTASSPPGDSGAPARAKSTRRGASAGALEDGVGDLCRAPRRPHKHKEPTDHGFLNPPLLKDYTCIMQGSGMRGSFQGFLLQRVDVGMHFRSLDK